MKNSLIGVWRLISFEFRNEADVVTYPFGKQARGTFIYTMSGHFSVQLMRINRPKFAIADQQQGTTEEIFASYKGSISYFGTYTIDEENKIILHQVEGSIFPNMEGTIQIRYFEVSENRLQLKTPPFNLNKERVTGLIVWKKVSD
jgi:hypothetical protein